MELAATNKHDYGKMTFQEKRINRVDLDHYKKYENSVTALVPGINHISSVGSTAMPRGQMN